MSTEVEITRVVATIATTLNDQRLEHYDTERVQQIVTDYDTERVQQIVTESLGGEQDLIVDDGGRRPRSHARVGAIRRTPSGEWIADRQNQAAKRSDTAVPSPPPQSKLRALLTELKVLGG